MSHRYRSSVALKSTNNSDNNIFQLTGNHLKLQVCDSDFFHDIRSINLKLYPHVICTRSPHPNPHPPFIVVIQEVVKRLVPVFQIGGEAGAQMCAAVSQPSVTLPVFSASTCYLASAHHYHHPSWIFPVKICSLISPLRPHAEHSGGEKKEKPHKILSRPPPQKKWSRQLKSMPVQLFSLNHFRRLLIL